MKTIVFAGDSHTWGQGPCGVMESFSPPAVCGEKRLVGFGFGAYVNLVRNIINKDTSSYARDYMPEGVRSSFRTEISGETLLRFQLAETDCERHFTCTAGGKEYVITVPANTEGPDYAYYTVPVLLSADRGNELRIDENNAAMLYRLEIYSGNTAVINCGVGSCPSFLYDSKYAEQYVAAYRPSVIVTELNTINDWLSGITPQECYESVRKMLRHFKEIAPSVLAHTVSPVFGAQSEPFSKHEYKEYVRAGIMAVNDEHIPFADVNKVMNDLLDRTEPSKHGELLFSDPWHVNGLGHRIYADEVYRLLTDQR